VVSIFNEHREEIIEASRERNRVDAAVALASSSANSKLMRDLMEGIGLLAATFVAQSMNSSAMEAFVRSAQDVYQTIEAATKLQKPVDLNRVLRSATGKRIMYRYVHTLHLEGICSQCIMYVGKITVGDGSDGVPRPPIHPHCKCALVPVALDEANIDEEQMDPIENLSKVPRDRLAHVIGPVRAKLFMQDRLTLRSLFTDDMSRMKTLEELGLDRNGKALKS
jgi:primosomal replication protein N